MVVQRGFTLLEMIVTIVILGMLSAGTFVSLQHLYLRSAKSKALSELSLESQIILDQVSALMYDRVPSSVIGYDFFSTPSFKSIYQIDTNFKILEWIGLASEAQKVRAYSGFVDMNASNGTTKRLATLPSISKEGIEQNLTAKFGGTHTIATTDSVRLVFAGSFDDSMIYSDFDNSFGWHGTDANQTYKITDIENSRYIVLDLLASKPNEIYEKYYLMDSAYAVARGKDIKQDASCVGAFNISSSDINNTLFLFYNYRPWKKETFCADFAGAGEGNVTILSKNVSGFEAGVINGTIYFNVTMNKVIKGSENNVTISKQKAVY